MYSRQYIPEDKHIQSIGDMVNAHGIPDRTIQDIFEPGGDLERHLPGYSFRSAQHQAAQMATRAFKLRRPAIIEAGTGTGKSIAFAVPAILHAMEMKQPVILSTSNNALIEQYARKDLPALQEALRGRLVASRHGRTFRHVTAKGRSNYLCRQALVHLRHSGRYDKYRDAIDLIQEFEGLTRTGDLAEFTHFDLKGHALAPHLVGTRENCTGPNKCMFGDRCFFYNTKDEWATADIIVTNHALLAISLIMPGLILPDFDGIIVDEAHQLERFCTDYLTTKVTPERWDKLMENAQEWMGNDMGGTTLGLRGDFEDWFRTLKPGKRPRLPQGLLDGVAGILSALSTKDQAKGLVESLTEQVAAIRAICNPEEYRDRATWIHEDDKKNLSIRSAPTNVGSFLKARLWNKPAVITSATLCDKKGPEAFDFIKGRLGVDTRLTLQLASPFDWDANCLYIFSNPAALRESDVTKRVSETYEEFANRWADKISPTIFHLLNITQGRAFVICTRTAVYKRVYANLVALGLPFPMKQQSDLGKPDMVHWFKTTPNPVLVCTSSYREGVDITGDQLSCVISDCIEFPNQNEPLEAARMEAMGKAAFQGYQVPSATTIGRQTVGRLLRLIPDRGVFVWLDPRLHTKAYGRQILAAMPGQAVAALDRRGRVDITGFLAGTVDAQGRPRNAKSERTPDLDQVWADIERSGKPDPNTAAVSERFLSVLDNSKLKTATRPRPDRTNLILDTRSDTRGNDHVA